MSLYERVAGLPVTVDGIRLELLRAEVSGGFQRVTTRVELFGGGQIGEGEDVTYDADAHDAGLPRQRALPVAGTHTIDSLSQLFERHLLPVERSYERWGFESAALDLALRQARLTFPAAFGREFAPLRFVVSTRLGSPPDDTIVRGWMAATPGLEFKLDPQSSWTPELFASLAATGRVRVLDLKSVYKDSPVDQPFDPVLYRRVRDMALAAAVPPYIEDPDVSAEGLSALAGAERLFSWDAPIHSVADIEGLALRPGAVNIKPSRFGSLRRLLDAIDYCAAEGIPTYGGGQFELGPGRDQIQAVAATFYPHAPNDVAPRDYNQGDPRPGLPGSPLAPARSARAGFGFLRE